MGKPRDLANVVATGNILADGAVAPAELTGVNATAAELNILDGVTATAAELNLLDGVTATTAELNHVDGVTSNVQTQIDTKAPVASPTFTGTATAPTVNASTALQIGGVAVTATAAELNKMDGGRVSASDINSVTTKAPIDGATFTGTTTIPTADINGGAIDGAVIGANSAAAVTATGLTISGGTATQLQTSSSSVDGNIFSDAQNTNTGSSSAVVQRMITSNVAGNGTTSADFQKTKAGALNINNNETNSAATITFNIGGSQSLSIDSNQDASFAQELIAKSYNETYVSLSAAATVDINNETGNVFALTTNQNTTFTFSNPPASGTAYGFTLKLTSGGSHTITYPNTVDFAGGTAPDAPASGETDILVFITVDGGTNWYGALAIDAAG